MHTHDLKFMCTCICACLPYLCLGPAEIRKWIRTPGAEGYGQLWTIM